MNKNRCSDNSDFILIERKLVINIFDELSCFGNCVVALPVSSDEFSPLLHKILNYKCNLRQKSDSKHN